MVDAGTMDGHVDIRPTALHLRVLANRANLSSFPPIFKQEDLMDE